MRFSFVSLVIDFGLPNCVPLDFTRSRPNLTLSEIIDLSNSEKILTIWNIIRPEGVEVSRPDW